jgi:hypothetical protein
MDQHDDADDAQEFVGQSCVSFLAASANCF